jgi:hypothetical protein
MNYRNSIFFFCPKVLIIILFTLLIHTASNAQRQIPERFWMHFDKSFYLTGETIWYAVYNINYHEHQDHSAIVYINFHDKEGGLLVQQKLELVDGKAGGAFDIPVSWKENYYYISCFTSWNLQQQDQGVFISKIPVYNSFLAGTANPSEYAEENIIAEAELQNIEIFLDKSSYTNRQLLKLRLASSMEGSCSMSIRSLDSTSLKINTSKVLSSGRYKSSPVKEKEKKLSLEGLAFDPISNSPVQSDVLCLYKTGSSEFTRLASSNSEINTSLQTFHGSITYQIFNMNPFQTEAIDFRLRVYGDLLLNMPIVNEIPPRTDAIRDYIGNAQLRTKVSEIFSDQSLDSLQGKTFSPIALKADKVYDMSKYQALKTLEGFFREIVTVTDLSSNDGVVSVKLKNMETRNYFMDHPWYLVDGYLTRDETQVMNIPFKSLVRVELFNTNKSILSQLDPVMIRSGMITVYTDNFSFENLISDQNMVNFQGFAPAKEFPEIQQISKEEARQTPELSPLLYWNPSLSSNASVELMTSDLQGDFLIEVHGYSRDGQKLYGSKKFSVKF